MRAATIALLLLSAAPVVADVDAAEVARALHHCALLPEGRETILLDLAAGGWLPAQTSPDTPLAASLATISFAREPSATAEEFAYALVNAWFMAASVLGNSALPSDQPAFTRGELTLGVLGLSGPPDLMPYCVLSGPSALATAVTATPGFTTGPEVDGTALREATLDGARLSLAVLDPDAILTRIEQFGLVELPYIGPGGPTAADLVAMLEPVSLMIMQMPEEEGENE